MAHEPRKPQNLDQILAWAIKKPAKSIDENEALPGPLGGPPLPDDPYLMEQEEQREGVTSALQDLERRRWNRTPPSDPAFRNIWAHAARVPPVSNPTAKEWGSEYESADDDRWQGLYLMASGSLMQLNAIVAGLFGVLLASTEKGLLKSVVGASLLLHVLSAFVLCWAARPANGQQEYDRRNPAMTMVDSYVKTKDTFRNYRRGWRLTLIALTPSSIAAGLFVLHAFGAPVQETFDQLTQMFAAYARP